jgi:RNA polymerase sigma-70 factor, ECF subfamily
MTQPRVPNDAEPLVALLRATASKDMRAFRQLYEATSSHLLGVLVRILRHRERAEDALQDCYLRIWNKADSYAEERGHPLAWMMTIARYRALDLVRAHREHSSTDEDALPMDLDWADASDAPDNQAETDEHLHRLNDCLAELSDEQRQAVMLAYYEGYTHPELADHMSSPLGTVKSWVRRGLQRLRDCLEP